MLRRLWIGLLGLALTAACGSDEGGDDQQTAVEIAVVDHADALTTGSGDNLCLLTLNRSDASLAIVDVEITAKLPGGSGTIMRFTHDDANTDQRFNQGETLTVEEPPVNLFDSTTVGQNVSVDLNEDRSGTLYRLASATWTPSN